MTSRDYKKFGLIISTSLTGTFEALINIIPELKYRMILSPFGILIPLCLSVFIMHKIKRYTKDLQIKDFEREITELAANNGPNVKGVKEKIDKCKSDINKLRREKSHIDFF